jgi:hypothetical protein
MPTGIPMKITDFEHDLFIAALKAIANGKPKTIPSSPTG